MKASFRLSSEAFLVGFSFLLFEEEVSLAWPSKANILHLEDETELGVLSNGFVEVDDDPGSCEPRWTYVPLPFIGINRSMLSQCRQPSLANGLNFILV
jgi:hypothetical protein